MNFSPVVCCSWLPGASLQRIRPIVAEGAGGAAELNLYSRDIANIRIKERELRLPVLLVADIERGGVFASGLRDIIAPSGRYQDPW